MRERSCADALKFGLYVSALYTPVANISCDARARYSAVQSQMVAEKANQQGIWSNDI